ncbi:MAG: helix-turn-helix transcriptional regulator [Prevotellaceae bacterium]|nr:helix-turn-helix transcriptional regulator [Prevotellaceae bacterium]
MKDRIRMIQNAANLSQQDFAKMIGLAPGSLSSVYTGRTQPTSNHVHGIHKAFPDININWLMFGEGDMYVKKDSDPADDTPLLSPPAEGDAAQGAGIAASLFEQPESMPSDVIPFQQPRRANAAGAARNEQAQQPMNAPIAAANNIDYKKREVKEIRVFFNDGTYESFVPSK